MRNTVKSYTFVAGTRTVHVVDDITFSLSQVCLFVNETQGKFYRRLLLLDKITLNSSTNEITFSDDFPVLAEGDKLIIDIDHLENAEGLTIEMNEGKKRIADALTLKGQNSNYNDTYQQMADKVVAIVSDITVTPIQNNNPYWHDLAYEVAQWADAENPYAFALLLSSSVDSIFLTGAQRYKTSDGTIYTGNQTVVIGSQNEAGRESKRTKYVIYRTNTPFFAMSFGSYANTPLVKKIIGAYNYGNDLSAISLDTTYIGFLINDNVTKNPTVFGTQRKSLTLNTTQFQFTGFSKFTFPEFSNDASDSERSLTLPDFLFRNSNIYDVQLPSNILYLSMGSAFYSCNNLFSFAIPAGLKSIISTGTVFYNSSLAAFVFPGGMETINIQGMFTYSPNLSYVFLSKPSKSLSLSGAFLSCSSLIKIELESDFNMTIDLSSAAYLNAINAYTYICQRLVDYRANAANGTPTLQTSTANNVLIGTNTQFTKSHRVGDTIYVNSVAKVIQSITDDIHLTMTTNGSSTASGLSYGMNKTLTLASAVKTLLTSSYPNWQTELQAKGWTIA